MLRVKLKLRIFTVQNKNKHRGPRKLWEMLDISIILIVVMHGCLHMSKLKKLNTLNMNNSLYLNHISIKILKKEILSKIMKCLTVEMYTKVVVIFL